VLALAHQALRAQLSRNDAHEDRPALTNQPTHDATPSSDKGYVMVIRELEGENGGSPRTIAFAKSKVLPLGYADLLSARLHEPLTIPLRLDNGTVIDTDIDGMDRTQRYSVNTILESPFTCHAVSLMKGGWLPPSLAATSDDPTILLDRNLVPLLVGRGRVSEDSRDRDFLDLFKDRPVKLNPLLYAMEGENREIPTPDQVAALLGDAVEKLRTALPKALVVADPAMLQGALGLIEDARLALGRKQEFLVLVAPTLAASVGRARLPDVWTEIVAAADHCSVRRDSLVVLAALSAAAVPNGASPAKALLKFKPGYAEADAYNALADLRALELLMGLFALFPQEHIHFCTADRALALFWTGIRASNFERRGSGFAFDLGPIEALLPSDTVQRWRASLLEPAA
jgi:hypothetical protein